MLGLLSFDLWCHLVVVKANGPRGLIVMIRFDSILVRTFETSQDPNASCENKANDEQELEHVKVKQPSKGSEGNDQPQETITPRSQISSNSCPSGDCLLDRAGSRVGRRD